MGRLAPLTRWLPGAEVLAFCETAYEARFPAPADSECAKGRIDDVLFVSLSGEVGRSGSGRGSGAAAWTMLAILRLSFDAGGAGAGFIPRREEVGAGEERVGLGRVPGL